MVGMDYRPHSRPWQEMLLERLGAPVWEPGKWGTLILRGDCPEFIWNELYQSSLRIQERYDVMMVAHDLTRVAFGSGITIDLRAAQYMGKEFVVGWYPNTDMAQIPVARGQHLDMIATLHDVSRGMDEDDNSLRQRIASILETPAGERWSEQRRYGTPLAEIQARLSRELDEGIAERELVGRIVTPELQEDLSDMVRGVLAGLGLDLAGPVEAMLRAMEEPSADTEQSDTTNSDGESLLCVFCDKPARIRAEGFAPECDECASQWED